MGRQSKRKIIKIHTWQSILHSLRTDFACTNEEIELISNALNRLAPQEITDFIRDARAGKIQPPERGSLILDMEDGNAPQELTVTNHPINLLHGYLSDKYGVGFGQIYWTALTIASTQAIETYTEFYDMLTWLAKAPFFEEDRVALKGRSEAQG